MNIKKIGIEILHSTKRITIAVLAIIFSFLLISYLLGLFSTTQVNRYTLTNGEKTIIFQEMRHIARGSFYENVHNHILEKKDKGYLYLYEGIFDIENAGQYYSNVDIVFTGDKIMKQPINIGDISKNAINADIVYSVIDQKIEEKIKEKNKEIEKENKNRLIKKETISFFDTDFGKSLREGMQIDMIAYTEKKLYSIRFLDNLKNKYGISLQNTDGFDDFVIIDKRNAKVIEEVYNSNVNNIYIQYGQDHFKGILKLLKEKDPKWNIINIEKINVL